MCGISGIVSYRDIASDLFQSIRSLEYRGYDSCGVAVLNSKGMMMRKNTGTVEEVNDKEALTQVKGHVGIAHTRWATHGKVSKANAHPHYCCRSETAVVHNGIISNLRPLRERLLAAGHHFRSDTDSEVVPHLIEEYLQAGLSLEKAFRKTLGELDGTFALALVSLSAPDRILCAKRESPLILGIGDSCHFVASDFNGFIEFTKHAVVLDDGEMAIVTKDDFEVKNFHTARSKRKEVTEIHWEAETSKRGGYPHYMLKEIYEQPLMVAQALKLDEEALGKLARQIESCRRTYLVGTGTTYYVNLVAQYLFTQLSNRYLPAISSDEFKPLAEVDKKTLVIAVSQSGETYDTLSALRCARESGAKTAAVLNVQGSSMARLVDQAILQGAGPEICVLSTKAALSQMIIFLLVAVELGRITGHLSQADRKRIRKEVEGLPALIQEVLNERSGFIRAVAHRHLKAGNWLYLGRGIHYAVALEAALKMKEVTYLHAEGMSAGFLKHGTISLIDDGMTSFFLIPSPEEGEVHALTLGNIEEVRAREGFVIGIYFDGDEEARALCDEGIALPPGSPLITPFLHLVASQLFAYFAATGLKRDIDRPRALAKSVTVA